MSKLYTWQKISPLWTDWNIWRSWNNISTDKTEYRSLFMWPSPPGSSCYRVVFCRAGLELFQCQFLNVALSLLVLYWVILSLIPYPCRLYSIISDKAGFINHEESVVRLCVLGPGLSVKKCNILVYVTVEEVIDYMYPYSEIFVQMRENKDLFSALFKA